LVTRFLTDNSWIHIRLVCERYAKLNEYPFYNAVVDAVGHGIAATISDVIYEMTTNRANYFASIIKDSLKGMSVDFQKLTRVLITRSEIDLGHICRVFDDNKNFNDGKTFKQWIIKSTASCNEVLLRIAGLWDSKDDNLFASQTRKDSEITGLFDSDKTTSLRSDTISVSSPRDDLHNIPIADLANYILTAMNPGAIAKVWQHLDPNKSGFIDKKDIINLLIFTTVSYIAQKLKAQGINENPKIDKNKLKARFGDLVQWIDKTKMRDNTKLKQEDFQTTFGGWLQEYSATKM